MKNEFSYFDEYPNEDPFTHQDALEYKDKVATDVIEAVEKYLEFSTTRDLIKLLAANL